MTSKSAPDPSPSRRRTWRAGGLTLVCLLSTVPTLITALLGPKSGLESLIIIVPLMLTVWTHALLGPIALWLAWRDRAQPRNLLVMAYMLSAGGISVGYWAVVNEVPTRLQASLQALTDPAQVRLQGSLRRVDPDLEEARGALAEGADPNARAPNGSLPLVLAASSGDGEAVELLLGAGVDPDLRDSRGSTALIAAARNRRVDVARRLLAAGADPNRTSDDGATALCKVLSAAGSTPLSGDLLDLAAALVAAGAEGNRGCGGTRSAFGLAVEYRQRQVVALLVAAGQQIASPATGQRFGDPLLDAVLGGSAEQLALLLAAGVHPDARNRRSRPALSVALSRNDLEAVRALLAAGADLGRRPYLEEIVRSGQAGPDLLALLLEARAPGQLDAAALDQALAEAAKQGSIDQVRMLLAAGAEPQGAGGDGDPLLIALQSGGDRGKRGTVIAQLLRAGADPNVRDRLGRTPLIVAIRKRNLGLARLLVAAGARVQDRDARGRSALHFAADLHQPRELVQWLSGEGADPNARDEEGVTPGCLAAASGRAGAVSALLAAGADVGGCGSSPLNQVIVRRDLEAVRLLLEAGADPDGVRHETPPLLIAAYRGFTDIVQVLLQAGANPDTWVPEGEPVVSVDRLGDYPYQYRPPAGVDGALPVLAAAALGGDKVLLQQLLTAGAAPNAAVPYGGTTLHVLAHAKAGTVDGADMVSRLLVAGADPYRSDPDGYTPVTLAARLGRVPLLVSYAEAGVDFNRPDASGRHVMALLAEHAQSPRLMRTVIDAGATPTLEALSTARARGAGAMARVIERALSR